jgi:hypothetical protein
MFYTWLELDFAKLQHVVPTVVRNAVKVLHSCRKERATIEYVVEVLHLVCVELSQVLEIAAGKATKDRHGSARASAFTRTPLEAGGWPSWALEATAALQDGHVLDLLEAAMVCHAGTSNLSDSMACLKVTVEDLMSVHEVRAREAAAGENK